MSSDKRILVVDDNASLLSIAERVLRKNGYSVRTATEGEEGLRLVIEYKPDLIILDIVMPGIDGYDVCKLLQQNPETEKIPVIFLSAKGVTDSRRGTPARGLEEIRKGYECGAIDFLNKPVKAQELLGAVKQALSLKQILATTCTDEA